MSIAETRREQMFPCLDDAQIAVAKRFSSESPRDFAPNEILFGLGTHETAAWLVIEGTLELVRPQPFGDEVLIASLGRGQLSGEIGQLSGGATLALGRAGSAGCKALCFDPPHLRALVIGSAEIGEIVMRALILRRVGLINSAAGPVLLGHPGSLEFVRLQGLLTRNGYPHHGIDVGAAEGVSIMKQMGLAEGDLPLMICPGGQVLKRPSEAEVGVCLGLTPALDAATVYDVAVVGAGPAGLATAVYAASEGLTVLVLDTRAVGGQAGASARIENYLGFPTGISGQALAGRAFSQAVKFGAQIALPLTVDRLECPADKSSVEPLRLHLSSGQVVQARTAVVASGARYRRPVIENIDLFEGRGVSYWASPIEARLCKGEEIALVGGGNSAGQAVVYLAPFVRTLHLIVRRPDLRASMSSYLIDRIAGLPNVELHMETEVVQLDGNPADGLAGATFRHLGTGEIRRCSLRHLFLFIGAEPNTEWLEGCVKLDRNGFVQTRASGSLQTSRDRVFVAGDVRSGSTKRVAAAVGDGAAAVAQIHRAIAGRTELNS